MLTPQEVSGHAFAKASFGGYNMAMVDEFLDALTEDYTTLYKENQVLKSKMKILVDKVEEYRATDDSMRKAFLVAQKSAEDIVAKAESERESLIRRAEDEARAKIAGMRGEMEDEQHRLAAAQKATGIYIDKLRELCRHELEYIDSLPGLTTPEPNRVETAARDIEATMQKVVEEEAPLPEPEVEEPTMDLDKELEELRGAPLAAAHEEEDEDEEESVKGDGGLYAELLELNITRKGEGEHKPRRLMEELDLDLDDEADAEAEEAPRAEPTRRFDNLQFGKDYEIR